ncbi:hypothetical protein OCU04_005580 [Sclerotinia nivalis]|uniref:Uncharacterized protein n=1 Tax=Sclerotinia nivalis TaxID=352851 RepID=A0A9X0APF3_9HELO|nr:hypothetical protein OCU04_005580 [Sclerotinia nivalis]
MSATNTPIKGTSGRKLKVWEIGAQAPFDINKNMNDFLKHIEDEPLGPGLTAIADQLSQMYEANDNEARQFTHTLQRRFQKECDGYDTDTAKFMEELASGLQARIGSLEKGKPIPEDWAQQMEDWHNNQFSVIRHTFERRKRKVTTVLGTKDSQAEKDRRAMFINQEQTLLSIFWEIKRSIDSKERTFDEVTSTLELQTPAKITTTGFATDPRATLPSTDTRSVSTPNRQMPACPVPTHSNKRQRTTDNYDSTESPESWDN